MRETIYPLTEMFCAFSIMDKLVLMFSIISCIASICVALVPSKHGKNLLFSTIIIWGIIYSIMIINRIINEYSYNYTNCTYIAQFLASCAIWFASVAFIVCYDYKIKSGQKMKRKWRKMN